MKALDHMLCDIQLQFLIHFYTSVIQLQFLIHFFSNTCLFTELQSNVLWNSVIGASRQLQ